MFKIILYSKSSVIVVALLAEFIAYERVKLILQLCYALFLAYEFVSGPNLKL